MRTNSSQSRQNLHASARQQPRTHHDPPQRQFRRKVSSRARSECNSEKSKSVQMGGDGRDAASSENSETAPLAPQVETARVHHAEPVPRGLERRLAVLRLRHDASIERVTSRWRRVPQPPSYSGERDRRPPMDGVLLGLGRLRTRSLPCPARRRVLPIDIMGGSAGDMRKTSDVQKSSAGGGREQIYF
jgi:hypothetical protein